MIRFLPLSLLTLLFAGCESEVIAVHDNTFASQFGQLNKDGWVVSSAKTTPTTAVNHDDPNVRVIKEADFSHLQFNTNFQVDDPKLREQLRQQNGGSPVAPPILGPQH